MNRDEDSPRTHGFFDEDGMLYVHTEEFIDILISLAESNGLEMKMYGDEMDDDAFTEKANMNKGILVAITALIDEYLRHDILPARRASFTALEERVQSIIALPVITYEEDDEGTDVDGCCTTCGLYEENCTCDEPEPDEVQ